MFKKYGTDNCGVVMSFLKITHFICIVVICTILNATAQDIKWDWNNPGEFYMYSLFKKDSTAFLGGGDADSYGNLIYVNRSDWGGTKYDYYLDVYEVNLADVAKKNQHPDNPMATGPIEQRTLTHKKTYNIPRLSYQTYGELYAKNNGVCFLGKNEDAYDVLYYDFASGSTSVICDSKEDTTECWLHLLGYDDIRDVWYCGKRKKATPKFRIVCSFNPTNNKWEEEFDYDDMNGTHFDGMEVVSTNTETKIYLSDMTSDYIGIVIKKNGSWETVSINKYNGKNAGNVEGMGYGALDHFWIASGPSGSVGFSLYEIGGGGLTVVEPSDTITVSIPVEQSFFVEEHSFGGTKVGDIKIISSNVFKAKVKIINAVPEFEVDSNNPFTITVANGANLDFNTQSTYQLVVVVYTGTGVIASPDTSVVTVHIIPKTGVLNNGVMNSVMSLVLNGNNLTINDLSDGKHSLKIINTMGQEILEVECKSMAKVDISTIPSGFYYIVLTSKNKKMLRRICVNR